STGRSRLPGCPATWSRGTTLRAQDIPHPRGARRMSSTTLDPVRAPARPAPESAVSWQSWIGLNAANFFLAEVTGVAIPFVADHLTHHGWGQLAIGMATGLAGLGVFLMQTPAGFATDRVRRRRLLLAGASLALGVCYGVLPLVRPRRSSRRCWGRWRWGW